jgi:hypothetical protein
MEQIREPLSVIVEESDVVEATLLVKIICKVVSSWQITSTSFHRTDPKYDDAPLGILAIG